MNKHGMTVYLIYKNKHYKQIDYVVCFNLIDGDILIWVFQKVKPIIHKIKYIQEFYCEYTRY